MKTVREIMTTDVVWISASARVKTAARLMKSNDMGALPVMQGSDEVPGLVTYLNVLGEPEDTAVADVMMRDYVNIDPDMTVYDAARVMVDNKTGYLIVMEEGRLVGIVSHGDLMPELGKTFDPLTGLPWSDTFRDWAMDALKRGMEISILFFDLDKFGVFNKEYGHVVGDNVLKQVADVIVKGIDPDVDLACRYGGDEFVIVSLRHADDAIKLGDFLKEGISRVKIPDLPGGVSASFGLSGGRRTKEREDVHYAATIDDLVTRASKNCTASKPHRAEPAPQTAASQPAQQQPLIPEHANASFTPVQGQVSRLKIQSISFTTAGAEATIGITLSHEEHEYTREVSGYVIEGKNILRLVAEATAGAVCKALAPGHGIVIDEVLIQSGTKDEQIVTVVAVFITPRFSTRAAGSAVVKRGDQFRAAAAALLAAVNRQYEIAPKSESVESSSANPA